MHRADSQLPGPGTVTVFSASGPDVEACSFTLSSEHARRCGLIQDVLDETCRDGALALPLRRDEIRAWLLCVDVLDATAVSDTNSDISQIDDKTMLLALKAADYLQDDATAAAITTMLARALTPADHDTGHHTGQRILAPTLQQKHRAQQIGHATLPPTLIGILAAIEPTLPAHTPTVDAPRTFNDAHSARVLSVLANLLLLLPKPFHAAVVQARFPALERCGTLTLPVLPRPAPNPESGHPALTAQLLAAVATLTQQPQHDGGQMAPAAVTGNAAEGSTVVSPTAQLTQLTLSIARHESPKCFAELARLTTLQSLDLHFRTDELLRARIAEFTAVLRALPVLRSLSITVREWVGKDRSGRQRNAVFLGGFLQGIAALQQLVELKFDGSIRLTRPFAGGGQGSSMLYHLSGLARLSRLVLEKNQVDAGAAPALADALRRLPGLRELELDNDAEFDNAIVLQLCRAGGASTLHLLRMSSRVYMNELVSAAANGGGDAQHALCALRTLRLTYPNLNEEMRYDTALGKLLCGMHELQSLAILPLGRLEAQALTAALPKLLRLTKLDIGSTCLSGDALCAVLGADEMMRGRGGEGLRSLFITGAELASREEAERLAWALGALPRLQEVAVMGHRWNCGVDGHMHGILRALRSSSELRRLRMSMHTCPRADKPFALPPLLAEMPQIEEVVVGYAEHAVTEGEEVQLGGRIEAAAPWMSVRMVPLRLCEHGVPVERRMAIVQFYESFS